MDNNKKPVNKVPVNKPTHEGECGYDTSMIIFAGRYNTDYRCMCGKLWSEKVVPINRNRYRDRD